MKNSVIRINSHFQHYDWGTFDAIPSILKINKPDTDKPLAELWVGAHPNLPSMVVDSGTSLDKFIHSHPVDVLGETAKNMNCQLPYLFKILSAKKALSIQVHPNKEQASAGFAAERSQGIDANSACCNYKDDNHKPELIYALTYFVAMAGFKPPRDIAESLSKLNLDMFSQWQVRLNQNSETELKAFYTWLLFLDRDELGILCSEALKVAESSEDDELIWLTKLHSIYGNDSGIFFPLILNLVTLKPGQAMFLGAGCPHAYLEGTGIEVMANSDNVLRGGLTSKFMDRTELISITQYSKQANAIKIQEGTQIDNITQFDVPVDDFQLELINLSKDQVFHAGHSNKVELYFVLDGQCSAEDDVFSNAMSFIVTANKHVEISALSETQIARVYTQL